MGNGGQKGRQLVSCGALVWAEHPLPGGNVLAPAGALKAFSWLHFPSGTLLGSWGWRGCLGTPWFGQPLVKGSCGAAPWAVEQASLG